MRVILGVALVALLLGSCGNSDDQGELEILTGSPPAALTQLDLGEARLKSRHYMQWNLRVRSLARKSVQLKARLEEPVPSGVRVELTRAEPILGGTTADMRLALWTADEVGSFQGELVLYSDDLPGWSYRYRYSGTVVDRADEGRHLQVSPLGVDVGQSDWGEEHPFQVVLASVGTEAVTIRKWLYESPNRLKLEGVDAPVRIEPGEEWVLKGVLVAPRRSGAFREGLKIVSDADRSPERLLWFGGKVPANYALLPARLVIPGTYPDKEPRYRVKVTAREGLAPFRVARLSGHERFFEVESLGSPEPSAFRQLELRMRKDAPLGRHEIKVQLHLDPGGEILEWPIEVRIVGAIQPVPDSINFGRAKAGTPLSVKIRLVSFSGRPFEVKAVTARHGYFSAEPKRTGGGWEVEVRPAPNLKLKTPYRDLLEIETDDPDVPRVVVEAYLELVP